MSSFIEEIAPIIQRLAPEYGIACPSAVIAQAILESGWGVSELAAKHHNYFGIKCGTAWVGASVDMATREEIAPGVITDIRDNFRAYASMADGVRGYFELLQLPRYSNLKGITDPRSYLQTIKDDGYCTASTYVEACMKLVEQYDLTKYDGGEIMPKTSDIGDRMYYWCAVANLGYGQDDRWDIRDGGTADCAALYLFSLWEAGYLPTKPTWGNTDTLRQQLEPLGFKFVAANNGTTAPRGVGLLRAGHVAVSLGDGMVAQASINENGGITGGKPGDQTGNETNVKADPRNWEWWIYPPDSAPTSTTSTSKPTTTGGQKVHNFGTVQNGTRGAAVCLLQAALNLRANAGLVLDGISGANTVAAIKAWQKAHGLTVDGICGVNTWNSLLAA